MGAFDHMKRAFTVQNADEAAYDEQHGEYDVLDDMNDNDERLIERGGTDIARAIAPSSVIFHEDYFKLNETYQRVMYLESWPVEVEPNWLRSIFQWHRAIDISIYYQPLPVKSLLNKLRSKSARESAELEKDESEGMSIDYSRVQRLEDSLTLQEMLQRGETKPFQISLLIAIRANNLTELNELTVQIEKQIDAISARTRRADLRQKDAFLSVLPFGRNYIADAFSTRNMHTQGAQYSFPLANADLTHPDGIWYGVNRSTNSNVILDRFQLQSPHSVVLGSSGSGKSYGAKLEMLRALMDNMPVMVIDPDGECERLAAQTGGQFITIGPSSQDRINVMDFAYIADGVEDQLTPKILSVIKLIGAMMNPSGDGYGLNAEQVQILDQLLRGAYADFGYTQDPRTQIHASSDRMPIFSDVRARMELFIRENEHLPHAQSLVAEVVASIGPYCAGGMFANLFDQHSNVDLREQFVVFNVKPLTAARNPHLLALGMHSVLEFVWNTTMNRQQMLSGTRRLLFVDEAHVMMRSPESAQFLEEMLRRARKCNVGVTVLTQDPEDFVRPDRPQGKLILANSSMQVALRMKRRSLELLQDILGLDDTEVDLLATSETGNGMIFAMNDRVWISMKTASPREHEMITTNPDEVAAIEARRVEALGPGPQAALPAGPDQGYDYNDQDEYPPESQRQLPRPHPDSDRMEEANRNQPRRSSLGTPSPMSQIGPPPAKIEPLRRGGPPKPLPSGQPRPYSPAINQSPPQPDSPPDLGRTRNRNP